MLYAVTATLIEERAADFYGHLTDGSIEGQQPDGAEIVDSMQRARIGPDGRVRWTEVCFCATPLAHERQTQLDTYFTDIETQESDEHRTFDGSPLMDRLAAA